MHLGALRAGVFAVCANSLVSTSGGAQPTPEPLSIQGSGSCPAADAVRASIFQLTTAERRRALPPGSRVTIVDLGTRYRVSVVSEETRAEKTFADAARECDRRARFAAVFAVLTLMPPELGEEPESKTNAGVPPASSGSDVAAAQPSQSARPKSDESGVPAKAGATAAVLTPAELEHDAERDQGTTDHATDDTPAAPKTVRLELFGLMEQGLVTDQSSSPRAFAGELRAAYTRGSLSPVLGLQYSAPSELTVGESLISTSRLQASLGARLSAVSGAFSWGGELSLLAALQQVRGIDVQQPAESSAFSAGLRASALVGLATGAVGPVLELHASLFPAPSTVIVLPRGESGHLPALWLGASLGMFLAL